MFTSLQTLPKTNKIHQKINEESRTQDMGTDEQGLDSIFNKRRNSGKNQPTVQSV